MLVDARRGRGRARARRSTARGIDGAARRQPPDAAQVSGEDYDVLRDAIVETGVCSTGSRPSGTRSPSVFDAAQRRPRRERRAAVSARAARRSSTSATSGYEGERTRPLAAAARDLARRRPHLARARPRHGGEDRALAADRRSRSCRWRCWSCSRRSSARCRRAPTTSSCRRMPSTTSSRSCRSASSRPSSRRSCSAPTGATACSRSTRRGRSRRRLRRLALGGLLHRRRPSSSGCPRLVLFVWNAARRERHSARGSATTGTSCRGSCSRARAVAAVCTTLALFVASFTTRRAYAAIGTLAVLFIGGGDRRHRRGELRRQASRTCSRSPTSRRC